MSISSLGRIFVATAASLLAAVTLAARADAQTYWSGDISVSNVNGLPTQKSADIAHVSLVVSNTGDEGDALLAVDVPPQIANAAGFDALPLRVYRGANLQRSQPVFIKAGETRYLDFEGVHLVIYGIQGPFTRGLQIPVRLTFQNAGVIDVLANIGMPIDQTISDKGRDGGPRLVKARFQPPSPMMPKPMTGSEFRCSDGSKMVLTFVKEGDGTDAVVWLHGKDHRLAYQPAPVGIAEVRWQDADHSLTWTPGVHLTWINHSEHLMCGRGSHQH
jgi:copper(I)-binding protein